MPLPEVATKERRMVLQSIIESKKVKVKSPPKIIFELNISFMYLKFHLTWLCFSYQASKKFTHPQQLVEFILPSKPEEGAVPMMIEGTISPQEKSMNQITEGF